MWGLVMLDISAQVSYHHIPLPNQCHADGMNFLSAVLSLDIAKVEMAFRRGQGTLQRNCSRVKRTIDGNPKAHTTVFDDSGFEIFDSSSKQQS